MLGAGDGRSPGVCGSGMGVGEGPGFGVEAGIGMGLVGGVKGQVSVGGAG